jgi:signal transduction histidine kinase
MGFGMMALLTLTGAMLIRTMRREADAALERSAMLAGVSHELRTPLAVIRSAADNMRAGVVLSPTSVAEYGTIVMEHADRLTRAVDQASDIARLIGGRRALNPVRVNVQNSVAAVLNQMPQAQRVHVACTGVEEVIVDRDVFEAIVRNLVENALAYSAADSPVQVTISRDRRVTSLCVADRGVGISAADRARIFGPFVRGRHANASRRGGLGLGLTIVAQLVDRLGGDVRVEPRSDGGTLFTVTFSEES